MSASYMRKYGAGTGADIYINIPKAGSANHAVGADWTPAAGDVKISKDGGAAANIGTLPTAVAMGNSAIWKFVFTDAELQAAFVSVTVSDSATKAVEDTGFSIETYGNASAQHAFDLDTASVAQTGDSFARLGAPAGASVSADVAAVKVDTAAILVDTGTDGVVVAAASKTGYSLTATTGLGNQTANITGNLSGSVGSVTGAVGSVTGAVGSVTGNVGGNVAGSVGSVTGLTASDVGAIKAKTDSLTFTVAGLVDSNALRLSGSATAADNLEAGALGLVSSTCAAGSTTTSIVTNLTEATDDHYNGRVITFTSGALAGQSTSISDYVGATKTLTVVPLTEAPANTDAFVIS